MQHEPLLPVVHAYVSDDIGCDLGKCLETKTRKGLAPDVFLPLLPESIDMVAEPYQGEFVCSHIVYRVRRIWGGGHDQVDRALRYRQVLSITEHNPRVELGEGWLKETGEVGLSAVAMDLEQ